MSQHPLPLARTTELDIQTIGDETLVYDRLTDKASVLNSSATTIWRASNGQRTISEIAEYLSQETPTSEQTVSYALGQMQDLLAEPVEIPNNLQGISRRKFLQRAAFVAAAAAVPVVVSIVAPPPAHAASGGCCVCQSGFSINVDNCVECDSTCSALTDLTYASCSCDV